VSVGCRADYLICVWRRLCRHALVGVQIRWHASAGWPSAVELARSLRAS